MRETAKDRDVFSVRTAAQLGEAARQENAIVEVVGIVGGLPTTTLAPGVELRGGKLLFEAGGLRLTRDNVLQDVTVDTAEDEVAIGNDPSQYSLGTMRLTRVRTLGQVLLTAEGNVTEGHVDVDALHVIAADLRGRTERPAGFGAEAMQGAFTLWNRQADPAVVLTGVLRDVSAGSAASPVRGSGVFVAGCGTAGGTVDLRLLSTGVIHTDGGIPPGTPDLISGGVFVVSGAVVEQVVNVGPVTTYGQNDMVLDNWGAVRTWVAEQAVTSHGPSGIGVVNFGAIERLDVRGALVTHGTGARAFNLYDGTLAHATFASIRTTGDGAVAVQVARELPKLEVTGDLTTSGGKGLSLVKGVQTRLRATAVSIQRGGHIRRLFVGGRLATTGDAVVTLEVAGRLDELEIVGGIGASGANADAVHITGEAPELGAVQISSEHGRAVVREAPDAGRCE